MAKKKKSGKYNYSNVVNVLSLLWLLRVIEKRNIYAKSKPVVSDSRQIVTVSRL